MNSLAGYPRPAGARPWLHVVLSGMALVGVFGNATCRPGGTDVEKWKSALASCDYGEACSAALGSVLAMKVESRETQAGLEARFQALRTGIYALAALPTGLNGFLTKAGLTRHRAFEHFEAEAKALKAAAYMPDDMAEALTVLGFLGGPECEGFQAAESVRKNGGFFAEFATMAELSALAQIFVSAKADMSHVYGEVARSLVGCTVGARADSAALLVEARNILYDLIEGCAGTRSHDAAYRSTCDEAGKLVAGRPLALPLPDVGSGDLLGAMLPKSVRGVGVAITPPWALVLTAGSLGIWDQTVLDAGVRKSDAVSVKQIIDLRKPHIGDDIFYEIRQAFKTRKPYGFGNADMCPIIVDRSTSSSELFEVLDGLLSESKAIPMIAVRVAGRRSPTFVPVNYRLSKRILVDPSGIRVPFGEEAPVEAVLSPFRLDLARMEVRRSIDIGKDYRAKDPDLREAYRALVDAVGQRGSLPVRLKVQPTVPVGLLLRVMQTLALRVPEANLETVKAFDSAGPLRGLGGGYEPLATLFVVIPSG